MANQRIAFRPRPDLPPLLGWDLESAPLWALFFAVTSTTPVNRSADCYAEDRSCVLVGNSFSCHEPALPAGDALNRLKPRPGLRRKVSTLSLSQFLYCTGMALRSCLSGMVSRVTSACRYLRCAHADSKVPIAIPTLCGWECERFYVHRSDSWINLRPSISNSNIRVTPLALRRG